MADLVEVDAIVKVNDKTQPKGEWKTGPSEKGGGGGPKGGPDEGDIQIGTHVCTGQELDFFAKYEEYS